MQSISNSQKSTQRRSPVVENPSQSVNSSQAAPATRSSSGSTTRSSTYKGKNVRLHSLFQIAIRMPCFWVQDTLIRCHTVAVSAIVTNREECHSSSHSHEATSRNTHAMVEAHSKRRAGLRRLRPPRIRIQYRLPGIHGDWG